MGFLRRAIREQNKREVRLTLDEFKRRGRRLSNKDYFPAKRVLERK